jgi:hypothetical protein
LNAATLEMIKAIEPVDERDALEARFGEPGQGSAKRSSSRLGSTLKLRSLLLSRSTAW